MIRKVILLALFLPIWGHQLFAEDQPFWRKKPEVYRRIMEEREVVISAKVDDLNGQKKFLVKSAGLLHAPLDFCYKKSTAFSEYGEILPYIIKSKFDDKESKLWAQGSFLGFKSEITIKFDLPKEENNQKKISYEVVEGFLKGMTGIITEETIGDEDEFSLVSMDAVYPGKISMPSFLISWGFEFAAQKMAVAMRKHIEEAWQAQ